MTLSKSPLAQHALILMLVALALLPFEAHAEQEGKIQILLLGDSTTEGSVPRRLRPAGPHLETVLEQLLAAEGDLPPCRVINSSLSGEYIRRLLDSGRYDRDAAKLPGLDYILIRYGLNDHARLKDFSNDFPQDYRRLIARLRQDHPSAVLIPMTVIPFSKEQVSNEINGLIREAAQEAQLSVFDIYPRYAAELEKGPNMLNYRRYPLAKIPRQYHDLVQPFVHGPSVEVMANELDAILGRLPGWYDDRHPNLAGYNVIADETAKYLAARLRQRKPGQQPLIRAIEKQTLWRNRDGQSRTWFHPRVCMTPGPDGGAVALMTLQEIGGSDYFGPVHWSTSSDLGKTWSEPQPIAALGRDAVPGRLDGLKAGVCDVTPQYHPPTGAVIALGHVVFYKGDYFARDEQLARYPVYVTRSADGVWSRRKILEWDDPRGGFIYSNNCGQRVVLPNGDVQMSFTFGPESKHRMVAGVQAAFDGDILSVRKVGPPMHNAQGRGLLEPSVTRFGGQFWITMRAEDNRGYVSVSENGLDWEQQRAWSWEDGTPLEMSTTQQHWLTHSEALFLVYTRQDPTNKNVIRWRAPLWIAQVDPDKRCLIRSTERVVLPLVGDGVDAPDKVALMGNFDVTNVSPQESWVTVGEWIPATALEAMSCWREYTGPGQTSRLCGEPGWRRARDRGINVKLLRKALVDGSFLLDLDERDMPSIFHQVANYLVARGVVAAERREELESRLRTLEEQHSTAIGNAVAVPHAYLDAIREPVIVFVRLAHAVNLGALDGVPTRFVCVLLGPMGATAQHLDCAGRYCAADVGRHFPVRRWPSANATRSLVRHGSF